MIRNLIFDLGQVLIRWEPQMFTKTFNLSAEEEALLRQETFEGGEWDEMDHGTITAEAAIASICRRLPERLHPCVAAMVNGWWELALKPMPGMAELIGELKGKGYGIYLLSNACLDARGMFHQVPGSKHFDGVYISAEHLLLKPQREIYEDFLKTFGLSAESCCFIDDKPVNIEGAAAAGITGIVFRGSAEELRRELAEKGVN